MFHLPKPVLALDHFELHRGRCPCFLLGGQYALATEKGRRLSDHSTEVLEFSSAGDFSHSCSNRHYFPEEVLDDGQLAETSLVVVGQLVLLVEEVPRVSLRPLKALPLTTAEA